MGDFDPVARTLAAAMEAWFEQRPHRARTRRATGTIAVNSTALESRAKPLVEMLARRGGAPFAGQSILDVGCGFGAVSVYLAWRGACVVGIDPNPAGFAVGRAAARQHGLDIELREGRMESIDAPDEAFDFVVMNNALCYVLPGEGRRAALAEVRRVLRDEGTLVIREPNRLHPLDPFVRAPGLPLLPYPAATRLAAAARLSRPPVRLASPAGLRRALRAAGLREVRQERYRSGLVPRLAKPVARYQHLTARR